MMNDSGKPTAYALEWVKEQEKSVQYRKAVGEARLDGGLSLLSRLAPELEAALPGWKVDAWPHTLGCPTARLVVYPPNDVVPCGIRREIHYEPTQTSPQHRVFHSASAVAELAAGVAGWLITAKDCAAWWAAIEAALPVDQSSVWAYITTSPDVWAMQRDQGDTTLVLSGSFIHRGVIDMVVSKGRWTNPGNPARSVWRSELRVGHTTDPAEALARVCSELYQVAQDLVVLGSSFSPRVELGAAFTAMLEVRDLARTMVPPELRVGCVFENLGTPKFNIFREGVCPASITCDVGDGQKPLRDLLNEAVPVIREQIALMMDPTRTPLS